MACPCEFPQEIPWSCIRDVIRIVRAGEVVEQRFAVLRHACCIGGCCANIAESGVNGPYQLQAGPSRTIGEVCNELEVYLDDTGVSGVPEGVIMNLLMELLSKLFCEAVNP